MGNIIHPAITKDDMEALRNKISEPRPVKKARINQNDAIPYAGKVCASKSSEVGYKTRNVRMGQIMLIGLNQHQVAIMLRLYERRMKEQEEQRLQGAESSSMEHTFLESTT